MISLLLLSLSVVSAQLPDTLTPVQTDSLHSLVELSRERPTDGDVWFRVAEAYLKADSLKQATDAGKKAIRREDSARAYDLMGRILSRRKAWIRNAPPYFRKALAKDPTFVDAVYHLAQYHHQLGEEDEERFLRETIEIDPTYAQAYLDLGRFEFDRGENDEVRWAFQGYIDLKPDSPDGYYGLAVLATEEYDYEGALKHGRTMISVASDDPRGYAMTGQALAARGEHEEAADMFALYLWMIPEEERAFYEDLSLIASKKELQELSTTPLPEQDQYMKRFWKRHDPTLVTGGDIRRLEHYRRVWFARTYFSSSEKRWDRRGDVFIRYGEPEYRSRSSHPNKMPSLAVQSIKEKMANELFRTGTRYDSSLPLEVGIPVVGFLDDGVDIMNAGSDPGGDGGIAEYNVRYVVGRPWSWEVRVKEADNQYRVYMHQPPDLESGGFIGPVFPVSRDATGTTNVPWESWVYTRIGHGLEFVFTDGFLQGSFDFAPMPSMYHAPLMAVASGYDPGITYQRVSLEQPELFGPPPGVRPLDFYYDYATFRGKNGLTRLELYFGVPAMTLLDSLRTIRSGVSFHRKVALEGQVSGDLIQKSDRIVLDKTLYLSTARGGMIVSTMTVNAIPDSYRLAVQLTDRETGKWSLYMQDLVVPAYGDSLELSDLQVSAQASDSTRIEAFKKGDFWIVPAPSRTFSDSNSVFVYYEIYNMAKDGMGMSDYTVSYSIREEKRKQRLFGSLLRSLTGIGKSEATETTFTLQRYSWDQNENVFFEIEADRLEPGLKRVRVTITDNVTGQEASKEAVLWVLADEVESLAGRQ